jgi:hypothetical protein
VYLNWVAAELEIWMPINSDPMLYLLEDVATLWKLQKPSKT